MPRTDTAARPIAATPAEVYRAFVDPELLLAWLPPKGMSGSFERFDATPGGGYRMALAYENAGEPGRGPKGKTTDGTDVVEARFVELVEGERVVQEIDFVSDDPAFAGTMLMTWRVREDPATPGGSIAEIRAERVPNGISAVEHAVGLASSLANLARLFAA